MTRRFATPEPLACTIIPIAIREDLIVRIQGIPLDLTEAEARKIGAVVLAMANLSGRDQEERISDANQAHGTNT